MFIIDAQNDFCHKDGSLTCENSEKAVKNILVMLANNGFDKIVCTQDRHGQDYMNTIEGKHLPIWHCMEGNWGEKIRKEIYMALYEQNCDWILITKNTFMLKHETIEEELENCIGEWEVYICGFATDICVINNALLLKQFFPLSEINLIKNCCAGTSVEMHNKAIDIMAINHINILGEYHNSDNKEDNND